MHRASADRLGEGQQRKRKGQRGGIGEGAATGDDVLRRMQIEEKQYDGLQRTEIDRRWRTEIDFAGIRIPAQHVKPVSVGYGDDEVDASGT